MAEALSTLVLAVNGAARFRQADGSIVDVRPGTRLAPGAELVLGRGATLILSREGGAPFVYSENNSGLAEPAGRGKPDAAPSMDSTAPAAGNQSDPAQAAPPQVDAPQPAPAPDEASPQLPPYGENDDRGGSSFVRLTRVREHTTPMHLDAPGQPAGSGDTPRELARAGQRPVAGKGTALATGRDQGTASWVAAVGPDSEGATWTAQATSPTGYRAIPAPGEPSDRSPTLGPGPAQDIGWQRSSASTLPQSGVAGLGPRVTDDPFLSNRWDVEERPSAPSPLDTLSPAQAPATLQALVHPPQPFPLLQTLAPVPAVAAVGQSSENNAAASPSGSAPFATVLHQEDPPQTEAAVLTATVLRSAAAPTVQTGMETLARASPDAAQPETSLETSAVRLSAKNTLLTARRLGSAETAETATLASTDAAQPETGLETSAVRMSTKNTLLTARRLGSTETAQSAAAEPAGATSPTDIEAAPAATLFSLMSLPEPERASVEVGEGEVRYTAATDSGGVESFTETITYPEATAPQPPVSVMQLRARTAQHATTAEDTHLVIAIDAEPDAEAHPGSTNAVSASKSVASLAILTAPSHGDVAIQDGSLLYRPHADYHGTDSISFSVETPSGIVEHGEVAIEVSPVADSGHHAATLAEDGALVFDIREHDSFAAPADLLTAQAVVGSVALDGSRLRYTPPADFHGEDTVTYTARTTHGAPETGTLTLTITPVRDVTDHAATTAEDEAVTVHVLATDGFAPGATLTRVYNVSSGSAEIADNRIVYRPAPDYNGTASLSYEVRTPEGALETGSVAIDVSAVADTAVHRASTPEDHPLTLQPLDLDDFESDAALAGVGSAAHGTVETSGATITYAPEPDYFGPDAFTYSVLSPSGTLEQGQITVDVEPVADTSVRSATTAEDQRLTIDVLQNTTFAPGAEIVGAEVIGGDGRASGQVTVRDGLLDYLPPPDFTGVQRLRYTVRSGGSDETAYVDVRVTPVADLADHTLAMAEDTSAGLDVMAGHRFTGPVKLVEAVGASHGTVRIEGDRAIYTPAADFHGGDSFAYTVETAAGLRETASVAVTVTPVPDLGNVQATTAEDTPTAIDVLQGAQFSSPPRLVGVEAPLHGTAIVRDGVLIYMPAADYHGQDTVGFTVQSPSGAMEQGNATVEITPVRDTGTHPFTLEEDKTLEADVVAADGFTGPVRLQAVDGAVSGTASVADGKLRYVPDADFNGVETLTYTARTLHGGTEIGQVNITVTPVADTAKDLVSTDEDTSVAIDVLKSASFAPGATLDSAGEVSAGQARIDDGRLVYTPPADFHGLVEVPYVVRTAGGTLESGSVSVDVQPVADIVTQAVHTPEDQPVVVDVLTQGSFTTPVAIETVGTPRHGTVTIDRGADGAGPGRLVYTPRPDYNGADDFTYTVRSNAGNTETATVHVAVTPVTDVSLHQFTAAEDTPTTFDVLAEDRFASPATLVAVGAAAHGKAQIQNGVLRYTPNPDFHGGDRFTYQAATGTDPRIIEEGTVIVAVTPRADAGHHRLQGSEDAALVIDIAGLDSFAPGAKVTAVRNAKHGRAEASGSKITYTPDPDFHGEDTLDYDVKPAGADGKAESGVLHLVIASQADVGAHRAITREDTPVMIDVLATDTFSGPVQLAGATDVQHGKVRIEDGKFRFTPDPDYHGMASFTYTARDYYDRLETGTVQVDVTPVTDTNTHVIAATEDTTEVIDLDSLDSFAAPAELVATSKPAHGRTEIQGNQIIYMPDADFNGPDSFSYDMETAHGDLETGTIVMHVEAVSDVTPHSLQTTEDTPAIIDVVAQDNFETPARVTELSQPMHGRVQAQPDGSLRYVPNADYNGDDSFVYLAQGRDGGPETNTVQVVVAAKRDIRADTATTLEDTPIELDVLANDAFSAPATLRKVWGAAHGTVQIAQGAAVYTPAPDFNGQDTFSYQAASPDGTVETGQANVTVEPVADADRHRVTTAEDTPLLFDVRQADTFTSENWTLSADQGKHGQTRVTKSRIEYTPSRDFHGRDEVVYRVTLESGEVETGLLAITVTSVPDVIPHRIITAEDSAAELNVLRVNGFGPGASVTAAGAAMHGQVHVSGGVVHYTPEPDFHGVDTFTYTVKTIAGDLETGTVTVEVVPVADAAPHRMTAVEDEAMVIDVLKLDNFESASTLSIPRQPEHGTASIDGNRILYAPHPNFHGADTIAYTVTTAAGNTENNTIDVAVAPVNDPPASRDGILRLETEQSTTLAATQFPLIDFADPADTLREVIVVQSPAHGQLTLGGRLVADGDRIAAADIEGGLLQYQSEGAVAAMQFQVRDDGGTESGGSDTSAVHTLRFQSDRLIRGGNGRDTLRGGPGDDVLLGDKGGNNALVIPGEDYQIAIMADLSGSMDADLNFDKPPFAGHPSRLDVLKSALGKMLGSLSAHIGDVHVVIIPFSDPESDLDGRRAQIGMEIRADMNEAERAAALASALKAVGAWEHGGSTNYVAPLEQAIAWFGEQQHTGKKIAYLLSDGNPQGYASNTPSWLHETLAQTLPVFERLAAISDVHAVGIGYAARPEVLQLFDNTRSDGLPATADVRVPVSAVWRTEPLAMTHTDISQPPWQLTTGAAGGSASGDAAGRIQIADSHDDTATRLTSAPFVLDAADRALTFKFLSKHFHDGDVFRWSVERLGTGAGDDAGADAQVQASAATGADGAWTPVQYSDIRANVQDSVLSVVSNILEPGTYRLVLEVLERTADTQQAEVTIDELRLYAPASIMTAPIGQVDVAFRESDLVSSLRSGSIHAEPHPLADDKLEGGDGHDLLLGDSPNSDALSWPGAPAGGHDGEGMRGLMAYLKAQHPDSAPTKAEVQDYLRAHHHALTPDTDQRGGNDHLEGGNGDDMLYGQGGDDRLLGDNGADRLSGGAGDDYLDGGMGDDVLRGGPGRDTFAWNFADSRGADVEKDVVEDFTFIAPAASGTAAEEGADNSNGTDAGASANVDTAAEADTASPASDILALYGLLDDGTASDASVPASLDRLLDFLSEAGSTRVRVTPSGAAGPASEITLRGIDLTDGGARSDAAIIESLMTQGRLIVQES